MGTSVSEAISGYRTIRGFKPEPVDHNVIREIFEIARLAPSNSNTQPWSVAVASGKVRDDLANAIGAALDAGAKPNPHFPPGGVGLKGQYKERQYACAWKYYGTMGIDREDKAGREALTRKNWEFFGAPHAAFFSMPATMHRANAIDIGIFLQSVMLLMHERGIGCCAQGALAMFPDIVREHLDIPEENALLCGLSFGYEDKDNIINTAKMPREELDSIATFHG